MQKKAVVKADNTVFSKLKNTEYLSSPSQFIFLTHTPKGGEEDKYLFPVYMSKIHNVDEF